VTKMTTSADLVSRRCGSLILDRPYVLRNDWILGRLPVFLPASASLTLAAIQGKVSLRKNFGGGGVGIPSLKGAA